MRTIKHRQSPYGLRLGKQLPFGRPSKPKSVSRMRRMLQFRVGFAPFHEKLSETNVLRTRNPQLLSFFIIGFLLVVMVGRANAQNLSSSNVFVGYSFIGANLYSGQHANLNGWNISAEKKYLPFFGLVADFSGHYGPTDVPAHSPCPSQGKCPLSSKVNEYYFQGGVRGSYPFPRVRPFIELLFGAVRVSESDLGVSSSKNWFEETLDTGLDIRMTRRFAWRLDAGLVRTGSFTSQQNSLRASTGPVFLF